MAELAHNILNQLPLSPLPFKTTDQRVSKGYLTLTSQLFHFLPEFFPALDCFKAETLIDKNIATFQFLYIF